ncbi:MAG: hypothetical protein U0931_24365 [Vulcanimicrobiota bacterium]
MKTHGPRDQHHPSLPVNQNGGTAPTRTFNVTASAAGGDFVIFDQNLYLALTSTNQVEIYNLTSGASLNAPAGGYD